jgi:uncharacterized protein (DUF433 family)
VQYILSIFLISLTIPEINFKQSFNSNLLKLIRYAWILICWGNVAQTSIPSEQAIKQHKQWKDSANHYKFSTDLNKYITYSFKGLEWMPLIEGNHQDKLNFYADFALRLNQLGLIKESNRQIKNFIDYYYRNEVHLSKSEKEGLFNVQAFNFSLVASNFLKLGMLDSAKIVYKKGIEFTKPSKTKLYVSALNNYGLFFCLQKKELDSALFYFQEAKNIADPHFSNLHIYGSVIDNIADVYLEIGKLKEAADLYKQNFSFYKMAPYEDNDFLPFDFTRLMAAGSQLVKTQVLLKNFEEAEKTVRHMNKYLEMPLEPEAKLQYFMALEALYKGENKYLKAYNALHDLNELQDSIVQKTLISQNELQNMLNEITLNNIQENLAYEKQQKKEVIKQQGLRFWIAILIFTLVTGLLFFLYQRRKQLQIIAQQMSANTALKNQQLNYEIEEKKRDLSDFAINLTQSHQWAKDLHEQINNIKGTRGRSRKNLFEELQSEIKNKVVFDTETDIFYKKVDTLSASFYKVLHEKFPKLTKKDIRLCSLIRLKIDNNEIATLQNITNSSLITARYRLRKKLNLSENTDLDKFIQSL